MGLHLLFGFMLLAASSLVCANEVVTAHRTLKARENWELAHPENYSFMLERNCYCAGPRRVRVQVRQGRVVRVEDLESGERYTDEKTLRRYPTIEQLLTLIDEAMKKKPDSLTIVYDRRLGYPSRIYIDYSYRIADEEIDYRISNLTFP